MRGRVCAGTLKMLQKKDDELWSRGYSYLIVDPLMSRYLISAKYPSVLYIAETIQEG